MYKSKKIRINKPGKYALNPHGPIEEYVKGQVITAKTRYLFDMLLAGDEPCGEIVIDDTKDPVDGDKIKRPKVNKDDFDAFVKMIDTLDEDEKKENLEEWALENLQVDIDKRKSFEKLIKQIQKMF